MRTVIKQSEIDEVWRNVWIKERGATVKEIFGNRLFIEGYKIFKEYIPPESNSILDVGSGSGRFAIKFARDFPTAKIVAVDILEESLTNIERLKEELGLKNIETKKEDILNLSFSNNSFDIVFSDAVIQLLPKYDKAVQEMVRVLKPGGRLIISVVNFWNFHTIYKFFKGSGYEYGYEKSFTKRELRNLLKKNNLRVIAEDGFYPAYGIYRLKRYFKLFGFLGRILNRLTKIVDKPTGRFFSKNFGFEIVVVGQKI